MRIVGTLFALLASAVTASAFDDPVSDVQLCDGAGTTSDAIKPSFPLKVSANNRYLIDQNEKPLLIIGDSPQSMIGNLSQAETKAFIANRKSFGINTLWINLLCNDATFCKADGATFDGIEPFTTPGDLSTPNPVYFGRADDMIRLAEACGMTVLLDPIETSGWLKSLKANGVSKAFAYGQYLGTRYKEFPNIVWMHGNDFQSWQNPVDDALVQAVASGIRSKDPNHIHTVELNFLTSGSLDDPTWAPLVELDAAYTYFPTYVQVLNEYNRPKFKPVLMVEANYEFEHNPDTDGGSTQNLRRQGYWTMLSGAAGYVYGSTHTCRLEKGWESKLDTPGVFELSYLKDLFLQRRWFDLIPDQTHIVVTDGYDSFAEYIGRLTAYFGNRSERSAIVWRLFGYFKRFTGFGSIETNGYATSARTSDGSLVIAYLPTIRTVKVDMSKLAGRATARWFDPTNGTYIVIDGSPFPNAGIRRFTPPHSNRAGDGDWVLVLEAGARSE